MAGRILSPLVALGVAGMIVVSGCGRKRVDTGEDRPATQPPVAQDATEEEVADDAITMDEVRATIGERIYFDLDRSELRTDARETLQRKGEIMRQFPEISVRIEGHADERGTIEYNLALGERRADSARRYLIDLGIDPDRIATVSYGEERPAVAESNEAAWAENRRDEFISSMN